MMGTEYNFEKLGVYQDAMDLAKKIYTITKQFPKEERFGIISQMRRAAVSVPVNISEGKGRYYTKEFIQFLYISRGSLYEIMTLIKLCLSLGYIREIEVKALLNQSQRISIKLSNLIRSMRP